MVFVILSNKLTFCWMFRKLFSLSTEKHIRKTSYNVNKVKTNEAWIAPHSSGPISNGLIKQYYLPTSSQVTTTLLLCCPCLHCKFLWLNIIEKLSWGNGFNPINRFNQPHLVFQCQMLLFLCLMVRCKKWLFTLLILVKSLATTVYKIDTHNTASS